MLNVCRLLMSEAKKEGGALSYGDAEEVDVVLVDGVLKYFHADGEEEDIVAFSYCCDDEETLKRDIVDYLYRKNEEDVASLAEGCACYAYVVREPAPVEDVHEGSPENA